MYHGITEESEYTPFEGICLTDTFEMYEKDDLVSAVLVDNSERRKRQKALDIRVIIGNPPYSSGQSVGNDNNANVKYPLLDKRIELTYAKYTTATLKSSLYDSYIRAIRWASDRIGEQGVIGFVTNGGYIDSNSADGLRKCLAEEFSSLYFFHLRGNARTSGEVRRKEKDNVFGQGTRTPIVIAILVKNPAAIQSGQIYFHDIGDYLTREDKLEKISEFSSINGIEKSHGWQKIIPDCYNDWLNQRDDSFNDFIELGSKKNKSAFFVFENYSNGVKTNRDAWCYQYSLSSLKENISRMINFYNEEVERYSKYNGADEPKDFVILDSKRMSWTREVFNYVSKGYYHDISNDDFRVSLYRPFTKQHMYFNRHFNNCVYQMPQLYPYGNAFNLTICLSLSGTKGFSVMMTNVIPDLHLIGDAQCFPLYSYNELTDGSYDKKYAITKNGLEYIKSNFPSENISEEDVFYFTYGILHSEEYRSRYADNLVKALPRIPCVKKASDFWLFSNAGRELAELHLNYESVEPYKADIDTGSLSYSQLGKDDFYVEKMKFAKKGEKDTVIYNSKIRIKNIPIEAYDYVVNGKSALEWVMERQGVSTHKDSGIVNDANDWAIETMHNPRYPLELFLRVITVSLETQKIVNSLPKLDI